MQHRAVEGSVVAPQGPQLASFSSEDLAGSVVEGVSDGLEVLGGPARQISALGEVLAQQAVGVLVGRPLPRRVRIGPTASRPSSSRRANVVKSGQAKVASGTSGGPPSGGGLPDGQRENFHPAEASTPTPAPTRRPPRRQLLHPRLGRASKVPEGVEGDELLLASRSILMGLPPVWLTLGVGGSQAALRLRRSSQTRSGSVCPGLVGGDGGCTCVDDA